MMPLSPPGEVRFRELSECGNHYRWIRGAIALALTVHIGRFGARKNPILAFPARRGQRGRVVHPS
jgi:hypothetical protein